MGGVEGPLEEDLMIYVFYGVIFVAGLAWARAGANGLRSAVTVAGLMLAAFAIHNFLNSLWRTNPNRQRNTTPPGDPRIRAKKISGFSLQCPSPDVRTASRDVGYPAVGAARKRHPLVAFGRESYEAE
jgi:hypothetical protein